MNKGIRKKIKGFLYVPHVCCSLSVLNSFIIMTSLFLLVRDLLAILLIFLFFTLLLYQVFEKHFRFT